MSQSPLSLTNSIDLQSAGVLIANMLEAWLTAEPALELTEEAVDEHQDHPPTSEQAGVHLYPPIDAGPGATPSGEHRAPVCVARQSAGIGLATNVDPDPGSGPRSVRRADDGPRGFQDAGGGCLDGARGRRVCAGGLAPGALEPGLASPARVVRAHRYLGRRRRWVLRPGRLQRRPAAGPQRHDGTGRIALFARAPPRRQAQQGAEG
ncbi:hypothetical protein D9M72_451310 [compost metagenome]